MKKILIVLISIVCLSSCDKIKKHKAPEDKNSFSYKFEHAESGTSFTFYENGHRYIGFKKSYGSAGYLGVVHDPDCPCHMNMPVIEICD